METALRRSTWVLPGGRIEITDTELSVGRPVDVIVVVPELPSDERPSVVDVLARSPGHLAFRNADEVDTYIREEREAWDR
jgi:hypothetical protein